jgi:DNA helicase-2/ATP-dependent DNA helicase PcrA
MKGLRKSQQDILQYRGGKLGIAAVPGSGKTYTLSLLAANLIRQNRIDDNQEILVVTMTNSAVDNFSTRIAGFMKEFGLLPNVGYRVRTLHGLAHDIVRERPDLANLSEQFEILDERDCDAILANLVADKLAYERELANRWVDPNAYRDGSDRDYKVREKFTKLAKAFIREAKDLQMDPPAIQQRLTEAQYSNELMSFCNEVYTLYQRAIAQRSGVDFNDLIQLALQSIRTDPLFLERLQFRWPYILEDEAQDSSRLQQDILRLLSGENGNWVRVGDPNQAIFESFTTASPNFLHGFLREPGTTARTLPVSGRFAHSIRDLANELIRWAQADHPVEGMRGSLTPPLIDAPPPDDSQAENVNRPCQVYLSNKPLSPDNELDYVMNSVSRWLPLNPDKTVAILASTNRRAEKFVEALRKRKIPVVELLNTTQHYRDTLDTLEAVIHYLASPKSHTLAKAYSCWRRNELKQEAGRAPYEAALQHIQTCKRLEDLLAPLPDQDWIEQAEGIHRDFVRVELNDFRLRVARWQAAALLPIDQLILTIAQDLFVSSDPDAQPTSMNDLALAETIARQMGRLADEAPGMQLEQFARRLSVLKANKALSKFGEADQGFDPKQHKGQVVVATIHKAKGLEWDRVYFTAANSYDFPSLDPADQYISEYGNRDNLNLEAEVITRLKALIEGDLEGLFIAEGVPSEQARASYCVERMRLFFVAVTRACQDLSITANTGRFSGSVRCSQPLQHLAEYQKAKQSL